MIITEQIPITDQPENFNKKLYPFQLSTIYQMEKMEIGQYTVNNKTINTSYGVLANKTGTGKTLILLGLCKRNKNNVNNVNPEQQTMVYQTGTSKLSAIISTNINVQEYKQLMDNYINTTLIIIPHTLKNQWKMELMDTDLLFYIVDTHKALENLENYNEFDIILISSTFYHKSSEKFIHNYKWNRIIIDEIDSITHIRYIKDEKITRFMWFCSATFNKHQYIVRDHFNQVEEADFQSLMKIECDINYINNSKFVINKNVVLCLTPIYTKILSKHISDNVQELLNANDLENAILKLNGNISSDLNIIEVFKMKSKNDLENLKSERSHIQSFRGIPQSTINAKLKKIDEDISRITNSLESVIDRFTNIEKDNCSICLVNYIKPVAVNCCKNIFCFECLMSWTKNHGKCPLCRTIISMKDLTLITNKLPVKNEINESLFTKEFNCIKIIKDKPQGKFLIFSERDNTFNQIKKDFTSNKIEYKELKGSADSITKSIQKFNEGKLNVLLINAHYKGAGFNIEKTTDIIIYHNIYESLETQVIGRALRLNRQKDLSLNIHYLKYENEM